MRRRRIRRRDVISRRASRPACSTVAQFRRRAGGTLRAMTTSPSSTTSPTSTTPAPLLAPWARDLWTVAAPQKMMGLHLGTRMTVVRLPGGGILLHSPVPISPALRQEIDALGEVAHLI